MHFSPRAARSMLGVLLAWTTPALSQDAPADAEGDAVVAETPESPVEVTVRGNRHEIGQTTLSRGRHRNGTTSLARCRWARLVLRSIRSSSQPRADPCVT